ncbi:unnamed protein product [Rotaria magnacalcarata]|uniref:Large ribosomal subunit protein uL1 n=2 Tax=Rotaria magnacalcarata TaxID=392030 RepID=A0A816LU95_9BILA|nr:unnamed protein product [Rotaria magnacalcarata]CAF1942939.1 unnamed protein product [Rotaria magnacalcarata]
MCSDNKISKETLQESIDRLLQYAHDHHQRKFVETVELQIVLKNYDTHREKRFAANIQLRHPTRSRYKVCVYGDEQHCDEARLHNIPYMSADDLRRMNKDKKKRRKLEHRYHSFLASDNIIRQIPRLLGPGIGRIGKFPTVVSHTESLCDKIEQMKAMVRVRLKKQPLINVPVGHVNMTRAQLTSNISMTINCVVASVPKHWQQVQKVFIKTTMGPSNRLY